MEKMIHAVRRRVFDLASSEAVYLFCAFVFSTVFSSSLFFWYSEKTSVFSRFVMVPWGIALCLLRMSRHQEGRLPRCREIALLDGYFLWVLIPFMYRFGFNYGTISNAQGYMAAFFAIYAMTRESDKARRDRSLDALCGGIAGVSFIWAGMLLLCAAAVQTVDLYPGAEVFGIAHGSILQSGVHYNNTAMDCVCMMMMCFVGVSRRKSKLAKIAHAVPGVMMMLVIVLTQSRTGRYAALLAFAAGAYGSLQAVLPVKRCALRHAAAMAAAAVVLVGGFLAADTLTEAALAHYNGAQPAVTQAAAEEEAPAEPAQGAAAAPEQTKRAAVDATFSERTMLWKNLFTFWKNNPKYLLMGNGAGRTGRQIVAGTSHEAHGDVFVHNAYLQMTADFGLIGALMMFAFLAMLVKPVLRVFFARGEAAYPGGRALCMMVIAIGATGFMESQPLFPMTSMNMMLFYALAVLCAQGSLMDGVKR